MWWMLTWDNLSAGNWSRRESLQNQGAGHSKTHSCDNGKQECNTAGSFILDSNDWHPHLFLMNKTCAPKIMMSKACHAVKTLPPKAAQAAGNTEGQGNWPLFLETKSDHTCREKGWFKKTLVLFFCPAQSTNPSSQAPICWIAHSHLAPWPLFLPLPAKGLFVLIKFPLWPNLNWPPLSPLFEEASTLGSVLDLLIPILSKNPAETI